MKLVPKIISETDNALLLVLPTDLPWMKVLLPVRVVFMGQTNLFKNYFFSIEPYKKKFLRHIITTNVYINVPRMWFPYL